MNIGRFKRKFNFAKELIDARIRGITKPLFINFQITTLCNIKCNYCYAELDTLTKEPTTKELMKIVDEFAPLGTRLIRLLGGEPTLRKDLDKLINYIQKKGIICELVTNGYFIKDWIDKIKNVDAVCLSVDGDRESNDKCREKGSFDKVVEAAEIVDKHNIPFRFHCVITKHNQSMKSIRTVAELAKKHNVIFNFTQALLGEERLNSDVGVSVKEIKEFIAKVKLLGEQGYPISHSSAYYNHIENFPDQYTVYKKINKHIIPCTAGKFRMFVDSDGRVYGCSKYWKKGLSMWDVGTKKAWKQSRYDKKCYSCLASGLIEFDALISLKPASLLNSLRKFLI